MASKKQRPGANGAKLEPETLQPILAPATAGVNGLQLIVTTPEQLAAIVDSAVAKALGGAKGRQVPEYLDASELCAALKISAPTLRKMVDEGLPFLRAGELRRYDLGAVTSWMLNKGAP